MLNCYPTLRKQKAVDICRAFAEGCGGRVITDGKFRDGPAMFYGVNDTNVNVWKAAKQSGHSFYFADNSYFDASRGTHFRITRNAIQHSGIGHSSRERLRVLGVIVKPWRHVGEHVVICLQSESFMRLIARRPSWNDEIYWAVREHTNRPIRIRHWIADKPALMETLRHDLVNAHCLVTWSSCAAIEAILAGVPAICLGPSAAGPMAGKSLDEIESPPTQDGREAWAGVLSANQWSLSEMRSGQAWRALH